MKKFQPLNNEYFESLEFKEIEKIDWIEFEEEYEEYEEEDFTKKKNKEEDKFEIIQSVNNSILDLLESGIYSKLIYQKSGEYLYDSFEIEKLEMTGYCEIHRLKGIDQQNLLLKVCSEKGIYSYDTFIILLKMMYDMNDFNLFFNTIHQDHQKKFISFLKRQGCNDDLLKKIYIHLKMYKEYFYLKFKEKYSNDLCNELLEIITKYNLKNELIYFNEIQYYKKPNLNLLKSFKFSEKRILYQSIELKLKNKLWDEIKDLIPIKGIIWRSFELPFSIECFLDLCKKYQCPKKYFEIFINMLTKENEVKLYLAVEYECWDFAIQICYQMKSKENLLKLKNHCTKLKLHHIVQKIKL